MADRLTVPVGSGEVDVLVRGRADRGTIATLHPSESMHEALPLLAELTGSQVVAVNPRGVGRSSPLRGVGDATIEGMADDLDLVRQALGHRRWVIWGMSGGGMVALASAHRHPGSVAALIVDSTAACFASMLADPACLLSPLHPRWRTALAGAIGEDEAHAGWMSVPDVGWVLRADGGAPLVVSPREPSVQMRCVMPSMLAFDARPWLAAIGVPTLVLAGSADQVAPLAQQRALHAAIPRASLAVIDGAGHVPIGERPDDVGLLVGRFLASRVWGKV